MNIIVNDNTPQFESWLAGVIKKVTDDMTQNFPSLAIPSITTNFGTRYIRVMRDNSAHAFIDRTNGDVLKPERGKRLPSTQRGNIFDTFNGLGSIGPYGPAYLR